MDKERESCLNGRGSEERVEQGGGISRSGNEELGRGSGDEEPS